jgi:hypothetical protein
MELLVRLNTWVDRWLRHVFGFIEEEDWNDVV